MRDFVTVLAALFVLGTGACATKDAGNTASIQRTKIDYDSTRDGPRSETEDDRSDPSACAHVWEALARATHTYQDTTYDIPMAALCTPTACRKCGLVRHECERPRRR